MALVLEANYSKKLGLPGYSSHQYSITVRTEIADLAQVEAESKRLYALLQTSVDREIQSTGFIPAVANGKQTNGNGHSNGSATQHRANDCWNCSPKQRELILKIMSEQHLAETHVEQLALGMFGTPLSKLNKLQASGLIQELSGSAMAAPQQRGRVPHAGGRA